MAANHCLNRDELAAYAAGQLSEQAAEDFDRHVGDCESCRSTLDTLNHTYDSLLVRLQNQSVPQSYCLEPPCRDAVAGVKAMATPSGRARTPASSAPKAELRLPCKLGEYELLEKIGEGGMGAVYRARHAKLNRIVALKTLSPARLGDAQAVARFEREMRAIGQLRHPNIVEAHDAREIENAPLLIMEYIEGVTLGELARQLGPLAVPEACELIRQAALGLQCAHQHGLVHRDVKPSNLMLAWAGQVKLLDLGLARFALMDQPGEEITATGLAMGTADYIAPEQVVDSRHVDIRADIYSLGCTLYRLLAGQAPFGNGQRLSAVAKLYAQVHDSVPPLGDIRPDMPPELQGVLDRMLAKNPAHRFDRPADVAAALESFAKAGEIPSLIDRFRQARSAEGRSGKQGDSTQRSDSSDSTESKTEFRDKIRSQSRKPRTVFFSVIVTALVVLVIGVSVGVVLHIRRGQRDTVVHVPDGSQVTVRESGDVEVVLPESDAGSPEEIDWDRRFATWAVRAGARINLWTKDRAYEVGHEDDLPKEPFYVQTVFFWDIETIHDADLEIAPRLQKLQGLNLQRVAITDKAMPHIGKSRGLRWLALDDTKVTASGLSHLHSLPKLELLALTGLPVTDAVLGKFPKLEHLKHIALARTEITDDALVEVAERKSLGHVDLHCTAVTDHGLVHLGHLPRLNFLDLKSTQVSDRGLEELRRIPSLRKLNLRETKVTAEGVASLQAALPECKIEFEQ